MSAVQRDRDRCDLCGGQVTIRPTVSLWEFAWSCGSCGRAGMISHAHRSPPPTFEAEPVAAVTLPLFDEAR